MIREDGRSGKRRKYDGGFTESPAPCSRYTDSTSSAISGSRPYRACWTCSPETIEKGGTVKVLMRALTSRSCDPHRVAQRRQHLARAVEGLPAVRGTDVVDEQQIAGAPRLAPGVGLVHLVDDAHDVLADRIAVPEAGVEGQPVGAVDVHEVVADFGLHRPLVEEGDLVEPAAAAVDGMTDHRAAPLPGAERAVGLPCRFDAVGPAVALDGVAVVGAERLGDRGADLVVVRPGQQPALPFEPPGQFGGERAQHRRRVGQPGGTAGRGRLQAGEQQQAGNSRE